MALYGLSVPIIAVLGVFVYVVSREDLGAVDSASQFDQSTVGVQITPQLPKIVEPATEVDDSDSEGSARLDSAPPPIVIPNSVYPEHPFELYLDNIAAAQDGDVEAQYQVLRALRECDDIYRSEEQIRELASRSSESHAVQALRYRLGRCTEMHDLFDNEELAAQRKHWYQAALANGHPIVRSEYLLLYTDNVVDARETLAIALTSGHHEAISLAAIYVSKISGTVDPLASLPWEYLACEKNPGCSVDSITGLLGDHFHQHDIDDLLRKVDVIKAHLASRDFNSLLPATDTNTPPQE